MTTDKKKNVPTLILMIVLIAVIVICVVAISIIGVKWACECVNDQTQAEQFTDGNNTEDAYADFEAQKSYVLAVQQAEATASSDIPGMTDPDATTVPDATQDADATDSASATSKPSSGGSSSTSKPSSSSGQTFTLKTISVDFSQLLSQSSDVVGYLYLQDSKISYPVVQASTTDPAFYLHHAFDGTDADSGALFIDANASGTFSNSNTVIHGHRMNSGTMFGKLKSFAKKSYFDTHRIMTLYTPSKNYYVYIFAAYETDIGSGYEQQTFSSSAAYQDFLTACQVKSAYSTGVVPTTDDKIITLSTCVAGRDTKRFIVQGVLLPMA